MRQRSKLGQRYTMHPCHNNLRYKIILASLASLSVVCYFDYITGYDLHFFVFYFLPVSLCAWYLGRPTVVMMAVLSGVAWGLADKLSGHPYASNLTWYWNTSVCFSSVLIQGLVTQRLRFSLNGQKKAREDLARALEQQKQFAAEIQRLQSQLQVVCAVDTPDQGRRQMGDDGGVSEKPASPQTNRQDLSGCHLGLQIREIAVF
ncbi:MAG: hypothetical protein WBW41_19690 [Verrucomicrobiia bacterium]